MVERGNQSEFKIKGNSDENIDTSSHVCTETDPSGKSSYPRKPEAGLTESGPMLHNETEQPKHRHERHRTGTTKSADVGGKGSENGCLSSQSNEQKASSDDSLAIKKSLDPFQSRAQSNGNSKNNIEFQRHADRKDFSTLTTGSIPSGDSEIKEGSKVLPKDTDVNTADELSSNESSVSTADSTRPKINNRQLYKLRYKPARRKVSKTPTDGEFINVFGSEHSCETISSSSAGVKDNVVSEKECCGETLQKSDITRAGRQEGQLTRNGMVFCRKRIV